MPRIDAMSDKPRAGEGSMLTVEEREKASSAYYAERVSNGEGRIIDPGDGSAWFVPSDPGELARDLADLLGDKTLGVTLAATLGGIADAVERRVMAKIADLPDKTVAPAEAAAPTDAIPAEHRIVDVLLKPCRSPSASSKSALSALTR